MIDNLDLQVYTSVIGDAVGIADSLYNFCWMSGLKRKS